jgi:flagellar basal-body rod protein FlgG
MSSIDTAFNTAISGARFYEKNLAITAQNISAQGVHAYKKEYVIGTTLGYQDDDLAGTQTSNDSYSPSGVSIGLGVQVAATHRDFSTGDPQETNNPYDVMINGDGFFVVNMPDGTLSYTRVGSFDKSPTGQLVIPRLGYTLSPNITVPSNAIEGSLKINEVGQVSVMLPQATQPQVIGQLQLANFINNNGLRATDNSLFIETEASGNAILSNPGTNNAGYLKQKYLERSNINAVEEMTNLIRIQSHYDETMKVLKTGGDMLKSIVNSTV